LQTIGDKYGHCNWEMMTGIEDRKIRAFIAYWKIRTVIVNHWGIKTVIAYGEIRITSSIH